jgi:hypothetical protein
MNFHIVSASRIAVFSLGATVLASFASAGCSVNATAAPSVGCGIDDSVACDHATGYSCAPGDNPEAHDSSLVCSDGTDVSGATLYCCVQFVSSTCQQDNSVVGCTGYSFGFSCTGTDRPDEADPTLVCSDPTIAGGLALYCCTD